jgi:hypothetical protein
MYCTKCYKDDVVSQCSTEALFQDLLRTEDLEEKSSTATIHTENELLIYTDDFLKNAGINDMTMQQYSEWIKQEKLLKENCNQGTKEEKIQSELELHNFYEKKQRYKKVIELAKEEWMLSTDGVVKALRYNGKEKHFVAKVHYQALKGNIVKELEIIVSDDWVFDTYGIEFANKLIDHDQYQQYMKPLDKSGKFALVRIDNRIITRVKFFPAKHVRQKNERGKVTAVKDEVCVLESWKGLLEDGTVMPLVEDMVTNQFGERFVEECKRLGTKKFVPIPVGSCRSSVIELFPNLRCDNAPPVKYMQGSIDRCVYSSLASAFHHTHIPDLVRAADLLQAKSNRLCGGIDCLKKAKDIVHQCAPWLVPKKL